MDISKLTTDDVKFLSSIIDNIQKIDIVKFLLKEGSSDFKAIVHRIGRESVVNYFLSELEKDKVIISGWKRFDESDLGSRVIKVYKIRKEIRPLLDDWFNHYNHKDLVIMKKSVRRIAVDPTVLNTRDRLMSFLESMMSHRYVCFLPSSISLLIEKEEWNKLIDLLRSWEWNLERKLSEEWFVSDNFRNFCLRLNELCFSFEDIKKDLSPEEKELLQKIEAIIKPESPDVIKLAEELLTIAIVKNGGILSYTKHLKRWLKSLRRVMILEVSERTEIFSLVKREIKSRIHSAGFKGRIFITFLNITVAVALTYVLPTIFHELIDIALTEIGEEIIVGVITNGH